MQIVKDPRRERVWGRVLFMGPTGSGKSRGAIELATRLFDGNLPAVLINSEKGRGTLYFDRYNLAGYIDLAEENDFSPDAYEAALDLAEKEFPGGIYIIDSASHEWIGAGGILQQADKFGDWKVVRPKHNAFVKRILDTEGHIICCVRAKMKYEVSEEDVPGRTKPRQIVSMVGVGPIQSDDFQYEFNLVGRFEHETHEVLFSGHVDPLVGQVADLVENGDEIADVLEKWLSEGDPIEPPATADEGEVAKLRASLDAEGITAERIEHGFGVARRQNRGQLHPDYVAKNLAASEERLAKKRKAAEGPDAGTSEPAQEELATA